MAQWRALNGAGALALTLRRPGEAVENVAAFRLHAAFWRAAGRPYLYQQISLVFDHHEPARALARPTHDLARATGEHEQVTDALARGDVATAQQTCAPPAQRRRTGHRRAARATGGGGRRRLAAIRCRAPAGGAPE